MAGHPLRPATRRRLGRPSPHQQADRPRAQPAPPELSTRRPCGHVSYPVLDPVSRAYPRVQGRLPTCYSPVRHSSTPEDASAFDLHVLSTPPAFVLSQDQTLQQCIGNNPSKNTLKPHRREHSYSKKPHHTQHVHGTGHNQTLAIKQSAVEFSKNTPTPEPTPHKGANPREQFSVVLGVPHFRPSRFRLSNRGVRQNRTTHQAHTETNRSSAINTQNIRIIKLPEPPKTEPTQGHNPHGQPPTFSTIPKPERPLYHPQAGAWFATPHQPPDPFSRPVPR